MIIVINENDSNIYDKKVYCFLTFAKYLTPVKYKNINYNQITL